MRKLATLGLALTLAACGDATGPTSIVGLYSLQTVNGETLPVTVFQDATERFEILGGRVSLNGDGTFSDATDFRYTSGQTVLTDTETATGTYVETGNNITFNVSDGGSYSMAVSGRTLTQVLEGITLVYRR